MADSPPDPNEESPEQKEGSGAVNTLRSVGSVLGRWGRKVGTLISEVSGQPSVPEELRESLDRARELRLTGDPRAARKTLDDLCRDYPDNSFIELDLALTLCAQALIENQAINSGSPFSLLRQ